MNVGEKLKEARIRSGLTQEQVAEKVMVSRVTVSHWENGKSLPDVFSLLSLSEIYQISIDELLKGDPKMTDKVKKDAKIMKNNQRLILTTGVLCSAIGIVYMASIFIGGAFNEFCKSALIWVLLGICFASWAVYSSQTEK